MRTALFLLLLLAVAAIPGSLVPQRSADPNGVVQYIAANPTLAPILDKFQVFDTYTSFWFSSIYLLLFISLIGCVVPRTVHHYQSLRTAPPRTPARLTRMATFASYEIPARSPGLTGEPITSEAAISTAREVLRRRRYRVILFENLSDSGARELSASAERGYLREAGNLLFHSSLIGVLIAVGIGGGFGFNGNRVIATGQTWDNTLAAYDSFNPGRFFNSNELTPFSLTLNRLDVTYDTKNSAALGQPLNYSAHVTSRDKSSAATQNTTIKVNEPLNVGGTNVYLLGNGYAPKIIVRDPHGREVFSDAVPFLPQDSNLTSLGVVKVPDGLKEQLGMVGFFYPTKAVATTGAFYSTYPDLINPVLTLNVFSGDLGLDAGIPRSVYALDTSHLTQLTGAKSGKPSIELKPGQTAQLPNGLGSVTLTGVTRFASFEIHYDPAQGWVLIFALCAVAGLLLSFLIPRRRIWIKATDQPNGSLLIETAGLARGDDPRLNAAVAELAKAHATSLGLTAAVAPSANARPMAPVS